MGRNIIVIGDTTTSGGTVVTGSPFEDIHGKAVARIGDRVLCRRHGSTTIATGDPTLIYSNQPVARHGDLCACGCALVSISQMTTFITNGGSASAGASAASTGGGAARQNALAPSGQNASSSAAGSSSNNANNNDEDPIPTAEVIELNPLVDADNNEIAGSTEPQAIPHRHPMIKQQPQTNRIAHRELKIRVYTDGHPANVHEGKQVTWSMDPLFTAPGATAASFRGQWTQAAASHRNRFETSATFGAYGFTNVSQQQGRTVVDAEGHCAIRVNLPPIGFNAARIKVTIEGNDQVIELIDLTVPAIIVIDPGHGGTTAVGGSSANNATSIGDADGVQTLEKTLTLDWGLRLRTQLQSLETNEEQIKVIMTREDDTNLGISARANVARDNGADIFLSLHFNGAQSASTYGPETWIRPAATNVNHTADTDFATRIQNALDSSIPNARQPGTRGYRGIKDDTAVSGTLNDASLGNVAGRPMSRAALAELEFITNQAVEDNLISGPNAQQNSQNVVNALADAIIDDVRNQE